jgi:hypothetical protein
VRVNLGGEDLKQDRHELLSETRERSASTTLTQLVGQQETHVYFGLVPPLVLIASPALRSFDGRASGRGNALDTSASCLPGTDPTSKKERVRESCGWSSGVTWPELVLSVDDIDAVSES